eukprot:scaffold45614_cov69-Phaeocystis_antarctica.AAC.1
MRWSEARCISSLVRPRGHTATSAIAKSDLWRSQLWEVPDPLAIPATALTNSDGPPVPPVAVPTSTPLTSLSCDVPALVPHMTNQSVSELTWSCSVVFHPR